MSKAKVLALCLAPIAIAVWITAAIVAESSAHAQTSASNNTKPSIITNTWQIKPFVLTGTSAVDISSLPGGPPPGRDVYLCWFDASTGSTATTITLSDKQSSPVSFANAVPLAANSTYSPMIAAPSDQICRWFPGGLTVTAGNANALSVYMSGKWWSGSQPF